MNKLNIFFDLDETLAHTDTKKPQQEHIDFYLEYSGGIYYTIVRQNSKEIVEWARKVAGVDNVYILTAAVYDYAKKINELAGWGFTDDHIIARETIERHSHEMGYGGRGTSPHEDFKDSNNLLIDNLPPRYNQEKIGLLNMPVTNYLHIDNYYGNDLGNEDFRIMVQKFILEKLVNPL